MPATKHLYTIAEYLALEEKSEGKNEYHDGEIIAMAGGSYRHSKLKTNLIRTLGNRLMGHRCEPLDSDMRVRVEKRLSYFYPDAQILCTPPTFDVDDPKKTTIVNPTVVFEVISESSEAYDRGEKFSMYRDMASLQEYVLISQETPRVEVYLRQADSDWLFSHFDGLEAVAKLRSVKIELPLAEIYAGLDFGPERA